MLTPVQVDAPAVLWEVVLAALGVNQRDAQSTGEETEFHGAPQEAVRARRNAFTVPVAVPAQFSN